MQPGLDSGLDPATGAIVHNGPFFVSSTAGTTLDTAAGTGGDGPSPAAAPGLEGDQGAGSDHSGGDQRGSGLLSSLLRRVSGGAHKHDAQQRGPGRGRGRAGDASGSVSGPGSGRTTQQLGAAGGASRRVAQGRAARDEEEEDEQHEEEEEEEEEEEVRASGVVLPSAVRLVVKREVGLGEGAGFSRCVVL